MNSREICGSQPLFVSNNPAAELFPNKTDESVSHSSYNFTVTAGTPISLWERTTHRFVSGSTRCFAVLAQVKLMCNSSVIPAVRLIVEIILANIITLVGGPIILLWVSLVLVARQIISLYLRVKYKNRYRLMDGADAAWGSKWYANDNAFMSCYIIEGNCCIDKIRERIYTRFINSTIPGNKELFWYEKMRANIVQKCGFYCWEKYPEFDIRDHIRFAQNDPSVVMCEEEVFKEMQSWVDKPLPSNIPQWEIVVIPNFIYSSPQSRDNQNNSSNLPKKSYYGLIWRINHSIMDGISAVSALQHFITEAPVRMSVDPLASTSGPWYYQVLTFLQILFLGSRSFIKTMFTKDSNCFHGPSLTGPKHLIWSKPFNVQTLKQIKNTLGSSTSTVFLSSIGGALKSLAQSKGLPVPADVIAGITCAVVPYEGIGPQNRFTVASFHLKVDEECPRERLEKASISMREITSRAEILKNFNLIRLTGLNPASWIKNLMNNLQATFLLSNVPGPVECHRIFGDDKLVEVIAWNTIKGTTGRQSYKFQ
jgi:hypothetical protein